MYVLFVQNVFEHLARLEGWDLGRLDLDRSTRPRIASGPRGTIAHLERSKPGDLHAIAAAQLSGDDAVPIEQRVDRAAGVGLREVGTTRERFDQFDFIHPVPPGLVTGSNGHGDEFLPAIWKERAEPQAA